jgi:spore germination protein YaaH
MKRTILFLLSTAIFAAAQPKALFYMIQTPNSVKSFTDHADKIDILVPAWYSVDGNGLVWGGPNPDVLKTASAHHVPVMPIVALMVQADLHKLFTTPPARAGFIASLLSESKKNSYTGFQIDFENVNWTDRDLLSALVAETAAALHKQNLQLTIATVPNAPGYPGKSPYSHWLYANWRGSFDLKALAQSADLICLMTYDQNTRWTMPGPVAGWGWTLENLDYALKVVPNEKLSLGIPLYGYHWYTKEPTVDKDGKEHPNTTADYISTPDVLRLATDYSGKPQWDADDHSAFLFFYRDQMREWIFYTDQRTFKDRYDLVKERGLQGFCSWVLGTEDPEIWNLLPDAR